MQGSDTVHVVQKQGMKEIYLVRKKRKASCMCMLIGCLERKEKRSRAMKVCVMIGHVKTIKD